MLLDEDGDSDKLYQVDSGRIGMDTLMALPNTLNRLEAFRHLTLLEWPHKKHKRVFCLVYFSVCLVYFGVCLVYFTVCLDIILHIICCYSIDGPHRKHWLPLASIRTPSKTQQ